MKRVVTLVASLAAIAVATMPATAGAQDRKRPFPAPQTATSFPQAERDYDGLFSGRPAVQRVRVPGGLYISRPVNNDVPQHLQAKVVEIDIRSNVPTLSDLQTLLEIQGVNLTIDYRSLQDGALPGSSKVDTFTAASRYQDVANSVSGGKGVQDGGIGGFNQGIDAIGSSSTQSVDANVNVSGSAEENVVQETSGNGSGISGAFNDQGERIVRNVGNYSNFVNRILPFRYFRGTVGELMRRLENTGNIAVWYDNGLIIGDVRRYSIAVPQQRDMIQSVVNEITRLGATDVTGSIGASQITYSAPPRTQAEIIEPYLKRISGNMSEITMQVALVTVAMSREAERGFDWSALNFGLGQNITTGTGGTGGGVITPGVPGAPEVPGVPGTDGSLGSNQGLSSGSLVFSPNNFQANLGDLFGINRILSVSGAINFLSRLGNTSVAQNVELRTLSGSPVILRSGEDIPYVQNVTTQQTGGFGGGFGGGLGGSQTARLGTGLTLNIDPRYDSSSGIVTIDVGLKLVDLVEFVQLNAGNQIGTLTQPRTREQGVNSILRLPAGQTTILGGIRREVNSDARTGPFGLFGIGSRDRRSEVFWLFAIVRPVITVYETADAPLAPRSVLDTRTTINPYDEGSYGVVGVPGPTVANPSDPQTTNDGGVPSYYEQGGLTPANRQPAGVTTSAPPAPRGVVVPGAGTQPEVNANIPEGTVMRDPGAPSIVSQRPVASSTPVGPAAPAYPVPAPGVVAQPGVAAPVTAQEAVPYAGQQPSGAAVPVVDGVPLTQPVPGTEPSTIVTIPIEPSTAARAPAPAPTPPPSSFIRPMTEQERSN